MESQMVLIAVNNFERVNKMHDEGSDFSYEEFISLNNETEASELDYLRIIFDLTDLHPDFIVSIARLLHPEFKVIQGCAFPVNIFSQNKFDRMLAEGKSVEDIQYWINLVGVADLFPSLSDKQSLEIANSIVACWNYRLASYAQEVGSARVIVDSELREVFVSLSKRL